MTALEKFAVYILAQTDEFSTSEIADFFGIEYEEAAALTSSRPEQWGQFFDLRELITLKNLVNQKTSESKVLKDYFEEWDATDKAAQHSEEIKHLDRIWTKLNTRIEALSDGEIPYGKAETRH